MMSQKYPLRIKAASASGGATAQTIRIYAEKGLIDAARDSNGNWMFSEDAPAQIRRILAVNTPKRKAA